MLFVDDTVLVGENREKVTRKLDVRRLLAPERKGLRINLKEKELYIEYEFDETRSVMTISEYAE